MSAGSPFKLRIRDLPAERRLPLPAALVADTLAGIPVVARPEPGEPAPTGELDLELDLSVEGTTVFAYGRLSGSVPVTCSRCLATVQLPVDEALAWTFLPHARAAAAADDHEVELEDEDVDVMSYSGDEIDLEPPVREQIVLALPLAPLCREDCKGLCPQCGADHNLGPCDCRPALWP